MIWYVVLPTKKDSWMVNVFCETGMLCLCLTDWHSIKCYSEGQHWRSESQCPYSYYSVNWCGYNVGYWFDIYYKSLCMAFRWFFGVLNWINVFLIIFCWYQNTAIRSLHGQNKCILYIV